MGFMVNGTIGSGTLVLRDVVGSGSEPSRGLWRNHCSGRRVPSLVNEGWTPHQEKYREATFEVADGVVRSTTDNRWL